MRLASILFLPSLDRAKIHESRSSYGFVSFYSLPVPHRKSRNFMKNVTRKVFPLSIFADR